ncbi:hypothetical protein AAVH_25563 [Aphelenchoides avenae]|nr:hypothetical protein AAVH_34205 [Aphelenchus avenae]KAH7707212.1 hypothetical protein AAVH_25563 [Aphelenchus avenae]
MEVFSAHRPMNGVCPDGQDPLAVFCCYTDEEFKAMLKTACPPGHRLKEAIPLSHRGCPAGHKSYHSYCCYEDVSEELGASTNGELTGSIPA